MIAEKWSDDTAIYYVYNSNGIAGFVYNGIPYVYQKNVFGDVVAIYNNAGGKVAGYRYNAYGECYIYNPELTANSNGSTIAEINPFRYRGYYYDTENGLYYLQSRYYDPAMGRFLNADTIDYIDPESINGINLYAYCEDNPVNYYDPSGHFVISTLIIGAIIGAAVSFGASVISQSLTGDKEINWGQVALDTVIGGISGALGASGISKVVSMIAGGVLGATGSVGGDLISSGGDWNKVNVGKAILMGAIGVGLGKWTGAGVQNSKAMVRTINAGKSWGSKAFLTSAKEALLRPNSGLTLETMYMNMARAISLYPVNGMIKVSVAAIGSTFLGNSI